LRRVPMTVLQPASMTHLRGYSTPIFKIFAVLRPASETFSPAACSVLELALAKEQKRCSLLERSPKR
jgi:hypothetical protein